MISTIRFKLTGVRVYLFGTLNERRMYDLVKSQKRHMIANLRRIDRHLSETQNANAMARLGYERDALALRLYREHGVVA